MYPQEVNAPKTALDDFIRSVQKGQENAIEIVREMLPDGKERTVLAIQNRKLQDEPPKAPERAESPRRAHVFHGMEGFCAYLSHHKTPKTVVFVDASKQMFHAVLDDKADKGIEIVTMEPQVHPLWADWDSLLEESISVKDLAKFMLSHRRQIGGDSKTLIADFSQIRASTDVHLEQGVGNDRTNGLMIHTKIQATKGEAVIDLPDMIVVHAPLFVGLETQHIEVDILLEPADPAGVSGVNATLTSADATTKTIEAFQSMCEEVKGSVDGIIVAMGRPDHKQWDYVGGIKVRHEE